jgi:hypothetical protein
MMIRIFLIGLAAFWPLLAQAKVNDPGPPYTDEQVIEISQERISNEEFAKMFPSWWAKAPRYIKDRIKSVPSERWWAVIICNIQGHSRIEDGGYTQAGIKCENEFLESQRRGAKSWSPDGQWVGPSEACRKRDKRSEWGELICD